MNHHPKNSWIRNGLLLSALLAGGVTTQLVPPYRDIAFASEEDAESTAASPGRSSSNIGGVDVNRLNIEHIGAIS